MVMRMPAENIIDEYVPLVQRIYCYRNVKFSFHRAVSTLKGSDL